MWPGYGGGAVSAPGLTSAYGGLTAPGNPAPGYGVGALPTVYGPAAAASPMGTAAPQLPAAYATGYGAPAAAGYGSGYAPLYGGYPSTAYTAPPQYTHVQPASVPGVPHCGAPTPRPRHRKASSCRSDTRCGGSRACTRRHRSRARRPPSASSADSGWHDAGAAGGGFGGAGGGPCYGTLPAVDPRYAAPAVTPSNDWLDETPRPSPGPRGHRHAALRASPHHGRERRKHGTRPHGALPTVQPYDPASGWGGDGTWPPPAAQWQHAAQSEQPVGPYGAGTGSDTDTVIPIARGQSRARSRAKGGHVPLSGLDGSVSPGRAADAGPARSRPRSPLATATGSSVRKVRKIEGGYRAALSDVGEDRRAKPRDRILSARTRATTE